MKEKKVKEKNIFSILFGNTEIDEKDELKSATDEERASIFQSKVTLSKLEKVHGGMVEEQTATRKQRRKDDFTKATEAATKLYPSKEEQELLQDADKFFGNTKNAKNSRAKEKSREEDDDRSR